MSNASIYDKVANSYDTNEYYEKYRKDRVLSRQEKHLLDTLINKLHSRFTGVPRILDVCCGDGALYDIYVSNHECNVVGVDMSAKQIEKARENNPSGAYHCTNFLAENSVTRNTYEGIICMYGLFNFLGKDYRSAAEKMYGDLQPAGIALINVRNEIYEGIKYSDDWCGKPMWWFLPGLDTTVRMLREIGFRCEQHSSDVNPEYTYLLLYKP